MKVYLRTFGCRANQYDSERVRAMVVRAGHEVVDDAGDADVAIFNSCAVTSEAERDLRRAVRSASARNAGLRTAVMGCASALPAGRESIRQLPSVRHVVAGADLDAVAEALGVSASPIPPSQQGARALLRVQDGCDEHCTFCATTIARGVNRSRAVDELVREATALAEHHPEIVITGTHIGSFGVDIGSSLGALMERLVSAVPRIRFRLSSLEATEVDERLFDLFVSDNARVAPHLHAPLQSGSNRLLKRMGRHWYTAESYGAAVERLASRLPAFGLGADIIVGFPGETSDDHAATVGLVDRLPFTYLHVFTYSPRPGTAAMRLASHVPAGLAHERSVELRDLGQRKSRACRVRRAGSAADVVVTSGAPDRQGVTEDYLTVAVRGEGRPRGARFTGQLALENDLLIAV